MKFSDGYWQVKKGFQPHYATEVVDHSVCDEALTLHVATRAIRHRGDTLQGPLLTLSLSSPLEDVIRVRVSHFEGGKTRRPAFPLLLSDSHGQTTETERSIRFKSGSLEAEVSKENGWSVRFLAGDRVVTQIGPRQMGYVTADDGKAFTMSQLGLDVGELVYGLGERFSAFVKNGQSVEIWNEDGGTGTEQAYKNVPFYMTNRGYGVFVNHTGRVSFEVASEKVSKVQFSVEGESLDFFVIYGPTPHEILRKYTALTGRPALPPAWSFGLWLTTSFTTNYDEETVTSFVQGFKDRNIPLHTFHFDCFWMKQFRWCDFEWDKEVFPDPVGMLKRMHGLGLKICVWINPYIAQKSPLFAEGSAAGYLLRKPDGSTWQWDMWQPGMGIVDFTNPDAVGWFQSKLRALVDMGVDSFKTDFGERIPTDVVYHDGSDPELAHNFYPYLYNKAVFEVLEETRGKGDALVFARSATAGCQQYPVHWGGDCYSDFPSMAESLRGGLSLGTCGFGFWSHDIGGFEGLPPADVYKRWVAFGLLSSHSRLHGSSSYRVPWLYDDEACDVVRDFVRLKCSLMPYLYRSAVTAHELGIPVMRPMFVDFPGDVAAETCDRQYMLGPCLLVAPVFSESGEVDFYLPPGRWTSWFSGEVREGGQWYRETHGFHSAPLYVRPGSLIAVGSDSERPDYDFAQGLTLRLYQLDDGRSTEVNVPDLNGSIVFSCKARRTGSKIEFETTSHLKDLKVVMVGILGVSDCQRWEYTEGKDGVTLSPSGSIFSVQL